MRPLRLACTLLCSAVAAHAQQQPPSAPRAFQFGDTLGANFSIADSTSAHSAPGDFDFLVGVWTYRFQGRRNDGAFYPTFSGHWTVSRKRIDNAFIEDHWRPDDRRASSDNGTWTYRVFNPQRGLWEMMGVGSEQGAWAPGLCWSRGTERLLVQRYGPAIMRIRYTAITDTSFLWRADRSVDDGKTWVRDWWTMEAKRVGR